MVKTKKEGYVRATWGDVRVTGKSCMKTALQIFGI